MSRKFALIIGNSEYEDTKLARLVTPGADVSALAKVLRAPEIGGVRAEEIARLTLLAEAIAAQDAGRLVTLVQLALARSERGGGR